MNKLISILCIFLLTVSSFSQSSTTTLDDDVQFKNFILSRGFRAVHYQKLGTDGFFRIEGEKIQFFDTDHKMKWQKDIPKLEGSGDRGGYIQLTSDQSKMYFLRYSGGTKNTSSLTCVDADGNIKSIDFNRYSKIDGINAVAVTSDHLLVSVGVVEGANDPTQRGKIYCKYMVFDKELNPKSIINTLPHVYEDTKYNLSWSYAGFEDEHHLFKTQVYDSDKGPRLETDGTGTFIERTIKVSKDGNQLSDETNNLNDDLQSLARDHSNFPLKHSEDNLKLYLNGVLSDNYRTVNLVKNVELEWNGKKSGNLVAEYLKEVSPGSLKDGKVQYDYYFKDLIFDPINKRPIIIMTAGVYYYIIQLDANLKITKIDQFGAVNYIHDASWGYENYYVPFEFIKKSYGEHESGHKKNALDFMIELKKKGQYTVLNYEDHQVLIHDDFKKGQSVAYRFE